MDEEEMKKELENIINNMSKEEYDAVEKMTLAVAKLQTNGSDFLALGIEDTNNSKLKRTILDNCLLKSNLCPTAVSIFKQFNKILEDFCKENNIKIEK